LLFIDKEVLNMLLKIKNKGDARTMKTDNVIEKASLGKKLKGRHFGKWIGIAVLAAMFCVAGLVMSGEAQADRFVNNSGGTVIDTQTGLMWADHDNGSNINWYNAKAYCEGYSAGGKSGWRMPTYNELIGLYLSGAYGPIIKNTAVRGSVWASETLGSAAACYQFLLGGTQQYAPPSWSSDFRALPVRSSN
jgi:hypothetical protein